MARKSVMERGVSWLSPSVYPEYAPLGRIVACDADGVPDRDALVVSVNETPEDPVDGKQHFEVYDEKRHGKPYTPVVQPRRAWVGQGDDRRLVAHPDGGFEPSGTPIPTLTEG